MPSDRWWSEEGLRNPSDYGEEMGAPALTKEDLQHAAQYRYEERQAAFNCALHRFGWKSLLSYRYHLGGKAKLLPLTKHFDNHHHLHVQGYNPHMVQIDG